MCRMLLILHHTTNTMRTLLQMSPTSLFQVNSYNELFLFYHSHCVHAFTFHNSSHCSRILCSFDAFAQSQAPSNTRQANEICRHNELHPHSWFDIVPSRLCLSTENEPPSIIFFDFSLDFMGIQNVTSRVQITVIYRTSMRR
jgi:hypothetical protein